jgi:hypothetical protein
LRWAAAGTLVAAIAIATAGCARPPARERYIDIRFPVATRTTGSALPRTVDDSGALWYVNGDEIVREQSPGRRRVLVRPSVRFGKIFWYDRAVYVLDGDGKRFARIDSAMHARVVPIPPQYAPVDGVAADWQHRAIVALGNSFKKIAVVDAWRWYRERAPIGIEPFAATTAGGPHGKAYLVVGDRSKPLVAIARRPGGRSELVRLPGNRCFAGGGAPPMNERVDVRGRDERRVWASSGEHVSSVDLPGRHVLRTWDIDGCAMQIVAAGPDGATVMVSSASNDRYRSALVRVDPAGVHALAQYGYIDGLAPAVLLDRFERLWWYDVRGKAFVCRTPLR